MTLDLNFVHFLGFSDNVNTRFQLVWRIISQDPNLSTPEGGLWDTPVNDLKMELDQTRLHDPWGGVLGASMSNMVTTCTPLLLQTDCKVVGGGS